MNTDEIKAFLTSKLILPKDDVIFGDWRLISGFRRACDFYWQAWYNKTTKRCAFNISQDSDWNPDTPPNCGFHDSYETMLDNVAHQLAIYGQKKN